MRALTLWQPWAALIACGAKRIETRPSNWRPRGPLAIHAGQRRDVADRVRHEPEFAAALGDGELVFGAIVAVVQWVATRPTAELVGEISERERTFGDYSPGRYGLILQDVQALTEPVPCSGQQGLWTLPPAIERQVRAALSSSSS